MLPTLDGLTASPAPPGDSGPHVKPKPQRPLKQHTAPAPAPAFVDLDDDGDDDSEVPASRPKKRQRAHMEEGHRVFHSSRQFNATQTKPSHPGRREGQSSQPAGRSRHPHATGAHQRPSAQPLRVAPIQSRSPSPERVAILPPLTPAPNAPLHSPRAPVSPAHTSTGSDDVALRLRKDRQAFYVKAASAARSSVKMDNPKPPLRPPIQPPGLFHLMACGLLNFDFECGEFHAFQDEVTKWKNGPSFMERLFAAHGRFHLPVHQVQPCALSPHTHVLFAMCGFPALCYTLA